MAKVLGVNAVLHHPAAALFVDGRTVAAGEEERFTRRKRGKRLVPFSTWEPPEEAVPFCPETDGADVRELEVLAERFPRAYREDADPGLRVARAGYDIVRGRRRIVHPVRPEGFAVSLRVQAGKAEDPFMWALHGRRWHLLASVTAAGAAMGALHRGHDRAAIASASMWGALTTDLIWRRVAPGPRTAEELTKMAATSPVLRFAAVWHWLRGVCALPRRPRQPSPASSPTPSTASRAGDRPGPDPHQGSARSCSVAALRDGWQPPLPAQSRPAAVLFDRDGTLIHDEPYNGDPQAVRPVNGALQALQRLRSLGIPTAVISNQSGIGRGLLTEEQVTRVNARVEALLGPLGPWEICPHGPDDGCGCRKPHPELIRRACRRLGVDPADCVVIGDIGSDIEAARAAGARAVLVPTEATRREEIEHAPVVARHLVEAVELALGPVSVVNGGAA